MLRQGEKSYRLKKTGLKKAPICYFFLQMTSQQV